MKTFTIDAENNITTHASAEEAAAAAGTDRFNSAAELSALAANWPGERLVEIWNSLPGATPVQKFKDRKTAIARIWKAIENLGEPEAAKKANVAEQGAHVAPEKAASTKGATQKKGAPKGRAPAKGGNTKAAAPKKEAKAGKKTARTKEASAPRAESKSAKVIEMISRAQGASLNAIMKATDWQAHSVRGFISGTLGKKMGLTIESAKREDGERVYSIAR
jgi:hypothetical protein